MQDKSLDSHYICKGLAFKRVYGDLILWKQILKQVKSKPLSHIIFITGDNKPDWWRIEHGETIGGRPELIEEIFEAGASLFYMYKPERFLEYARKYLQLEIKEESIQQVEEISISNNLVESGPELVDDLVKLFSTIERDGLSNLKQEIAKYNSLSNIKGLENTIASTVEEHSLLLNKSTIINFAHDMAAYIKLCERIFLQNQEMILENKHRSKWRKLRQTVYRND